MKNVTAPYVHSLCEDKSPSVSIEACLHHPPHQMKNVTAPYVHSLCEDKSPVCLLRLVFTTLRGKTLRRLMFTPYVKTSLQCFH